MPYIADARRQELARQLDACEGGELNYLISRLIDGYVRHNGLSYGVIEDILAALEGAKSEFYYRIARVYEDRKREENGEVFSASLRVLEGGDDE